MDDQGTAQTTYADKAPLELTPLPGGAHTRFIGTRYTQTFDSLQDALTAAGFTSEVNYDAWIDIQNGNVSTARKHGDRYWYGIDGGVQAVKAAIRDGWPEGVERMQEALRDIGATLQPRSVKRRRVWTDQGDALDIHRVYAGQLDTAWQRTRRQPRPATQTVTIAANITALAKTDAQALFWRGAAVLKLADMLTDAGYAVRVDAIRQSRECYKDGTPILQRVTVKAHDAPLDLSALAATVCLSGFFRVVLFSCMAMLGIQMKINKGHSEVYEARDGELAGVEACMSAEAARDWINEQIARLQGELPA